MSWKLCLENSRMVTLRYCSILNHVKMCVILIKLFLSLWLLIPGQTQEFFQIHLEVRKWEASFGEMTRGFLPLGAEWAPASGLPRPPRGQGQGPEKEGRIRFPFRPQTTGLIPPSGPVPNLHDGQSSPKRRRIQHTLIHRCLPGKKQESVEQIPLSLDSC